MKEIVDKLNFSKVKKLLVCERHCQENKKTTNHRLGKSISDKGISDKGLLSQMTQRSLKTQQ